MKILFNFKNFNPSDHLRDYANNRFEKLKKYIHSNDALIMDVCLEVDNIRHIIEVTLKGNGLHLNAREESSDMYASVDKVLNKIDAQLRKHSDKQKRASRSGQEKIINIGEEEILENKTNAITIQKDNKFFIKPMDLEEASLQLQNSKDLLVLFENISSGTINVLYKKNDNVFGLIETGK